MVNIRIVEALKHTLAILLQLVHREIEGLHEFVELHLADILAEHGMIAGIAHDVDTRQVAYG